MRKANKIPIKKIEKGKLLERDYSEEETILILADIITNIILKELSNTADDLNENQIFITSSENSKDIG